MMIILIIIILLNGMQHGDLQAATSRTRLLFVEELKSSYHIKCHSMDT